MDCWLVNTGWIGGPYGVGNRISIKYTRALLNAALEGKLAKVDFITDPVFGFQIPTSCDGVPAEILNPINSWENKEEYMVKYEALAKCRNLLVVSVFFSRVYSFKSQSVVTRQQNLSYLFSQKYLKGFS